MTLSHNVAYLDLTHKSVARIKEAMLREAKGREVRVEVSDYGQVASIAVRKANGWWATTMIPLKVNNIDSKNAEVKMLAFMGLVKKEKHIHTISDAVEFATAWTREHCHD